MVAFSGWAGSATDKPTSVLVLAEQGVLEAVDVQTGEPRWQQPLGGLTWPGGAVVSRGTVFISTPPAAFDAETGRQRWRAELQGSELAAPPSTSPAAPSTSDSLTQTKLAASLRSTRSTAGCAGAPASAPTCSIRSKLSG